MRKFILAISALFILSGCDPYVEVSTRFIVYNLSNESVQLIINGRGVDPDLPPQTTRQQTIQVSVPRSGNSVTGSGEQNVSVSIVFRNLRTGELTREITCSAGSRIQTTVVYEVYGSGNNIYYSTRCYNTY